MLETRKGRERKRIRRGRGIKRRGRERLLKGEQVFRLEEEGMREEWRIESKREEKCERGYIERVEKEKGEKIRNKKENKREREIYKRREESDIGKGIKEWEIERGEGSEKG